MARKRYTPEEAIGYLRTVEIEAGRGSSVENTCRKLGGISTRTPLWGVRLKATTESFCFRSTLNSRS